MFFHCKTCLEKENRISDLKEQIQHLRSLIYPSSKHEPSVEQYEADGVLSGQQHIIEIPTSKEDHEDLRKARAEIIAERDRILSGNI